jgi:hypothetical protein
MQGRRVHDDRMDKRVSSAVFGSQAGVPIASRHIGRSLWIAVGGGELPRLSPLRKRTPG